MSSNVADNRVDSHQLKHLLKAAIKLDMRSGNPHFGSNPSSKFPPILQLVLFQLLVSFGLAAMLYIMPAKLVAMTIAVTVVMTFTAINVMIEFGSLIISPDDHDIISPLPVNSRTFFYSKLINLLFYTSILTVALGLAPTVSIIIKTRNPMYLIAVPSLMLAANTSVSLAVASVYGSLLKHVSRRRIMSVLGYVQMALGVFVYAGYMIVPKVVSRGTLQIADITDWWVFLLPPTWYASFIGIAGDIAVQHWIWSSFLGIAVIGLLYLYCTNHLSIDYSRDLARTATTDDSKKSESEKPRRRSFGVLARLLNPEETAIFRLIWAQFKYDSRFKMAILAIVPMTVIYMYLAFSDEGGFINPFIDGIEKTGPHTYLIFFAVGIFPSMIQGGVLNSSSYQASWVFFATPANLTNVMLSTRKFIQISFIIPYLTALFVAFGLFFGNFLHAAMLLVVLYLLVMIQLSWSSWLLGGVPFSQPVRKGQNASSIFLSILMPVATIIVPMVLLSAFVFTDAIRYIIAVPLLIVIERVFLHLTRKQVAVKAAKLRHLD